MVSLPVRGEQKEQDRFTSQHAITSLTCMARRLGLVALLLFEI